MKRAFLSLLLCLTALLPAMPQTEPSLDYAQKYGEAFAQKDYASAFSYIVQFYNQSHSFESAVQLAAHFVAGLGTEVDLPTAISLYKSVADATEYDHNSERANLYISYSSRMYAILLFDIKKICDKEMFTYLLKADSVSADAAAQFWIGLLYMDEDNKQIVPGVITPNIQTAKHYFQKSAERNCIGALTELGIIYSNDGNDDKAFDCWQRAANIPLYNPETDYSSDFLGRLANPNYATDPFVVMEQNEAFYRLADCFYEMGDNKRASSWMDKVTLEDPRFLDLKAFLYAGDGKKQQAIDTFMREYELSGDTKALSRLAITHYVLWHDKAEAIRLLQHVIALGDTSAQQIIDKINSEELK